jgi:hypothetical protein
MSDRLIRAALLVAFALLAPFADRSHAAGTVAKQVTPQQLKVVAGDAIAQQGNGGVWHSVRILQVDRLADGSAVAHCLFYTDAKSKPTLDQLASLGVRTPHVLILASFFATGWERLGNRPPSKAEMAGYYDYLKHTNFPRYAKLMGLDERAISLAANEHYKKAMALEDQGNKAAAIGEYSIAIDNYPMFVEAIDNRGMAFMDLGHCKEAIADFEMSLEIQPNGEAAFVSRGECLLRLGKGPEAEAVFKEAIKRFPAQRVDLEKQLEQARALRKTK